MNKTSKKILNKAINLLKTSQFDRQWDNLWEHSTEQSNNLIINLFKAAKEDLTIKKAITSNAKYMPTLLVETINTYLGE